MAAFNAYIDEAGDEGSITPDVPGQGSSEWLVLGAVIVPEEDDLHLSHAVDDLRKLLNRPPPKPLHFRDLKHNKRRAAMDTLATYPFVASIVALWKPPQGCRKGFPTAALFVQLGVSASCGAVDVVRGRPGSAGQSVLLEPCHHQLRPSSGLHELDSERPGMSDTPRLHPRLPTSEPDHQARPGG